MKRKLLSCSLTVALAGAAPAAADTGGTAAPALSLPLTAPRTAVVGRPLPIAGQTGLGTGEPIALETRRLPRGRWLAVASAAVQPGGWFRAAVRFARAGRYQLRARPQRLATAAGELVARTTVAVYFPARASYYGPGLYGHRTACGQLLTPRLRGVASPTLPCGTLVSFRHGNRQVTVPVVDRGPFVPGVSFDLTAATARQLGVKETAALLALPLGRPLPRQTAVG